MGYNTILPISKLDFNAKLPKFTRFIDTGDFLLLSEARTQAYGIFSDQKVALTKTDMFFSNGTLRKLV